MLAREITSLQHPIVKHLVKLREDRAYRREKNSALISGNKMIRELSQRMAFSTLIVEKGYPIDLPAEQVFLVTPEILKKITGLKQPEPIAVEIAIPPPGDLKEVKRLLILDGISDPGNLGTLLRTALALGWEGVFITEGSTDPFHEKALRAAKGATFKISIQQDTLEVLEHLLTSFTLYAADPRGAPLGSPAYPGRIALALGNEAHGLSPLLQSKAQRIAIPMQMEMESLNVASAGAILMYELAGEL
ncbi:MAG: RNA methyltransferase [Verrucomicrobia bacterium]|nr:RNA methyltransferase [Verrucomicrobiota bacterium]